AIGGVVAGLWLHGQLVAARAHLAHAEDLQREVHDRDDRIAELHRELTQARIEAGTLTERLEQERRSAAEKLALVEEAKTRLADAFSALSAEALNRNNQAFLELARNALGQQHLLAKG